MPRAQKTSDERRGVRASGNTRVRKSRRKLTAWKHDARAFVMDPKMRPVFVEAMGKVLEGARRVERLTPLRENAISALRALYAEGTSDERALPLLSSVAGTLAELDAWQVDNTVIGETKRIGADTAFVDWASEIIDYDGVAEALHGEALKKGTMSRDQALQSVKDKRRR